MREKATTLPSRGEKAGRSETGTEILGMAAGNVDVPDGRGVEKVQHRWDNIPQSEERPAAGCDGDGEELRVPVMISEQAGRGEQVTPVAR